MMLQDDDGDDTDFVRCFTYETRDAMRIMMIDDG